MEIPTDVADALMASLLQPILSDLARETRQPIAVRIVMYFEGSLTERSLNVAVEESGSVAGGEVRMLVKIGRAGFRFVAEAIFKGLAPETGFSGFLVKGTLGLNEGKPVLKFTGRSNRYNVWNWSKDFRFQ